MNVMVSTCINESQNFDLGCRNLSQGNEFYLKEGNLDLLSKTHEVARKFEEILGFRISCGPFA